MSERENGQAASPYSLDAYSEYLPALLRPEVVASLSYYTNIISFFEVNPKYLSERTKLHHAVP